MATGTRSSRASDTASVSERFRIQVRADGVNATRCHRDAVVMIMRPAGQPKESYGDRSFQGIGKTTREAKQAAAKAALTKLRATMPGIKFAPGVIPFEWSDPVWKSTSASGAPDNSSLSHFSATMRPC